MATASAADVLKMIKEKEVKFVDFRFTDTRGKEQHVSVPAKIVGTDKFEDGHAFDGSSISGWKGIEASDMLLMPDPATANMDPFREEPTLIMTGDEDDPCLEPAIFMKRKIRSSGLVVIPKAGHTINLEDPDLFNRALLDFLTAVDAGRWPLRNPQSQTGSAIMPADVKAPGDSR